MTKNDHKKWKHVLRRWKEIIEFGKTRLRCVFCDSYLCNFCEDCPIEKYADGKKVIGLGRCYQTPFGLWNSDETIENAWLMYDFLCYVYYSERDLNMEGN